MKLVFFSSGSEFREWLEAHHSNTAELLVGFHKKDSGKGGITYAEALDEALCFGWIDGVRKSLDRSDYSIRFTPRRPGSTWSAVNTKRMAELMQANRVLPAGRSVFGKRDPSKTERYSYEKRSRELEEPYLSQFQGNEKAWTFFQAQAPSYRRVASWFVMSAKQELTRERRLALIMEHSARGERIPQAIPSRANRNK